MTLSTSFDTTLQPSSSPPPTSIVINNNNVILSEYESTVAQHEVCQESLFTSSERSAVPRRYSRHHAQRRHASMSTVNDIEYEFNRIMNYNCVDEYHRSTEVTSYNKLVSTPISHSHGRRLSLQDCPASAPTVLQAKDSKPRHSRALLAALFPPPFINKDDEHEQEAALSSNEYNRRPLVASKKQQLSASKLLCPSKDTFGANQARGMGTVGINEDDPTLDCTCTSYSRITEADETILEATEPPRPRYVPFSKNDNTNQHLSSPTPKSTLSPTKHGRRAGFIRRHCHGIMDEGKRVVDSSSSSSSSNKGDKIVTRCCIRVPRLRSLIHPPR